jgi:hypothetical protein
MRIPFVNRTVAVALVGMAWSVSSASPCDPALIQPRDDPNGYRLRGDRCEGIYLQPLSGSAALLVVSFTEAYGAFDPRAELSVPLDWTPLDAGRPTWLRAYGLRLRQYYRMDAERPAGVHAYAWETAILGNLGLSRRLLGAVAWQEATVGSQAQRIHLPLRIASTGRAAHSGSYELTLLAGVELTEVFVTLSRMDEDGRAHQTYLQKRPLEYGYYPPHQGIAVPISNLTQRGVHRLEIAAKQRDLESATAEFWFFHPGGQ